MKKDITESELRKLIGELKDSYNNNRDDNRPGRRRLGLQRYLKDVYQTYVDLHSRRINKKATRRIAKLMKLPSRKTIHPIRILIEASAGPEDNRAKSRWAQALKYAHGWLLRPENLIQFFKENGGISGVAAKIAVRDGTTRRDNNSGAVGPILNRVENNSAGISPQANTAG